ncbi:hypothetical protein T4C_3222 [Trichinella pseudospiralis]|uniref:Uncharacterized protein n=1 Tax=Trichinella pseudospiralis TaxID=6337 RepID=A0A0V1JX39_TRIPS|nr:hypothetical protein T4C_3222 [Trichinella pseudospiralis]
MEGGTFGAIPYCHLKLILLLCYCMRDGQGDWYMPSANTTHAFKSRILYGHFKEAYVHRQVHNYWKDIIVSIGQQFKLDRIGITIELEFCEKNFNIFELKVLSNLAYAMICKIVEH